MIHEGIQDVESVAMELSTASVNGTGIVPTPHNITRAMYRTVENPLEDKPIYLLLNMIESNKNFGEISREFQLGRQLKVPFSGGGW